MCTLKGQPVAGLGPQQNPGPPVWVGYVNVDLADDIVTKVGEAGGQVMIPPMDVMGLGTMAYFIDPVGAVFAVWQAAMFPGAGIVNEPGAFSWTELMTTDVEGSKEFYGKVFGWGAETQRRRPGRVHRVEGERQVDRRDDAEAADGPGRGAAVLGCLLHGHRH